MTIALKQLKSWLHEGESERLEFKEARAQFDADELTRYCVALANEHGGRILLGVNDKRQIVGSSVFPNIANLKRDQSQRVRLNIEADDIEHPDGRVVVVTVPPRPIGVPHSRRLTASAVARPRSSTMEQPSPVADAPRRRLFQWKCPSSTKARTG